MSITMKILPLLFTGVILFSPLSAGAAKPDVNVPFKYALGKSLFDETCSECHGTWGMGSDSGPPLMHQFYLPGHHGDQSFYRAALKGVQSHHWNFGDMPPVPGISNRALDKIVPYIRWLQKETMTN
jgi:mono/diheme cytochrome c family protein